MRHSAKSLLESLLLLGPSRVGRWLHRGRSLVLAYHNIVPHGAAVTGDASLHLSQNTFASQLDLLVSLCQVVPLQALVESNRGSHDRPRVAITFDDAYQGAVTTGIGELRKRGLPATIFVAPRLLEGRSFWWDELVPAGAPALPEETRARALTELKGCDDEIREWARQAGMPEKRSDRHATGASVAELSQAMAHEGLTLAAHSWSHPNLTALPDATLTEELRKPLEWLNARFDRVLPYLAYPYGLGDRRVVSAAKQVGYRTSFRIEGGWLPKAGAGWDLPRLNIPRGISSKGFELRLSGLRS
jgi:peptidoglycan/xylan/chitin deacetylase (PgdA/CDA1 family)